MEIARSVYPTYGLDLSRMVLGENTPKYQPFINERFSTYNGEPFAALYPQGPHFVAISFFPVRLSFRLYLPSANHPADQLQIVCCLDTYTRPKGRASANRLHDLARGTRKQKNSRGLLVHRCRSRAACWPPRRAVQPGASRLPYGSSTAINGHSTGDRGWGRLWIRATWRE